MDHFANFDEAFEYLKSMQAAREEVAADSLHRPAGQEADEEAYANEEDFGENHGESRYFWMNGSAVFAEGNQQANKG